MSDKLLQWAISKLMFAFQQKIYGQVVFIFEAGTLVRIKIENQEVPPKG